MFQLTLSTLSRFQMPSQVFPSNIRIGRTSLNNMAPGKYGDRKIVASFYYSCPRELYVFFRKSPFTLINYFKCLEDKRLVACQHPVLKRFWSPTLNFWSHLWRASRNFEPCIHHMNELALTTLLFLYIKDGEVLSSKFQKKMWKQWKQFR